MKTIIVSTGKNAPNGYGVQKYDNDEPWNILNGSAPNGVNAMRWLRKTTPDPTKLSPLASWLVDNVPEYCGGKMPHFDHSKRVRCYNGKTEAETMRDGASRGICISIGYSGSPERALKYAENFIKCYELEGELTRIDDWLFDQIFFDETDEEYWNRQADKMLVAGVKTVEIGDKKFDAPSMEIPHRREIRHTINRQKYPPPRTHNELEFRIAEINEWENKKMAQWADRPDNQALCKSQAATWRFRAKNEFNGGVLWTKENFAY